MARRKPETEGAEGANEANAPKKPYAVLPDARPRPSALFTRERCDAICESIANGASLTAAAKAAGTERTVVYDWRRASPEFAAALDAAEGRKETRAVRVIQAATEGGAVVRRTTTTGRDGSVTVTEWYSAPQWQAAAWLLERTEAARYGQRVRQELTGRDGGPVALAAVEASAEDLRRMADAMDDRDADDGPAPLMLDGGDAGDG